MRAAMILAVAAIVMIPGAGSLQAQGKSQADKADKATRSGEYQQDRDGRDGRKDDDRYDANRTKAGKAGAKPGRRVGPSPDGPGRRVGPNGATRDRSWGNRVITRRRQLGLSDNQVARISEIDQRYRKQYGAPEWSQTDSATRARMRDVRSNERREINDVLTASQRKQLAEMDRNRYDNR